MAEDVQDTEQKIKNAARKIFLEQGYEGAKIRQIADEAGVNLAMVNYYFRSKELLFKSIYIDTFREFLGRMVMMLNEQTPLEVKIWKIIDRYTDFILENPLLPMFVLSEQRQEGVPIFKELNIKGIIENSFFRKQLLEEAEKGTIRTVEPLQVIITIMSSVIFPVMAKPIVSYVGAFDEAGFRQFMETRKQIVPEMIMAYLRQT
ncbi:TetR/AcrR family transcriptional regulator [Fibrisoma montanum]|uniref:TetR/AcrR family transcriptional regulator n=1 Tax=Fibrisoma montanum TaxID=2305895 RepID=A0A418M6G8_9BACT|nr:TetR/AcrR family transcriptional regulator [Fibrisoma montanum]RIV21431.1 TetR/AcrR family transcriptional regulator [Fibrisoma montanum]